MMAQEHQKDILDELSNTWMMKRIETELSIYG